MTRGSAREQTPMQTETSRRSGLAPMGRRRLLLAGAAVPLLGLSACVAMPYGTYYRPSTTAAGAQLRRGWCQGKAGPLTAVSYQQAGLGVETRFEQGGAHAPGQRLWAQVTVPPGMAVVPLGPVQLTAGGRPLQVPAQLVARRGMGVQAATWIDPQALRPGRRAADPAQPHGSLRFDVDGGPAIGPRLLVEGLVLERDAGSVVIPPALMARPASPRSPDAYRTEEEQAAVRARAEACRRDTPQRACDNLVAYSETSHAGQNAALRWTARWTEFERGRNDRRLEGQLTLVPLLPGRWRLSDERFQVREPDRQEARPLRARTARVAFADLVEPGVPIPASGAETRLVLEVELPDGTPDFELAWPELRIAGATVALAPVRFERRSFDGGIEPFNC